MNLEICVDSVQAAIAAERGGAGRIELCSDLVEGGITPSAGLIASVRRHVGIALFVMIRPRGGDFCYTDVEFELMQEEIKYARELGADGVVLGLLDEQGQVDVPRTRQLVEFAGSLPVTFHRAIDMTPNPITALQHVLETGATRILTSGGAANVTRGIRQITRMVEDANGRITIMPGGGISPVNIANLALATGATEFHASEKKAFPSPVRFRKQGVMMGEIRDREYTLYSVQEEDVRALARALEHISSEQASARSS
jgi:copper homeostasis protein